MWVVDIRLKSEGARSIIKFEFGCGILPEQSDSTMSLRTAGPAQVLSHKCDIPLLVKDHQIVRDNCLTAQCPCTAA